MVYANIFFVFQAKIMPPGNILFKIFRTADVFLIDGDYLLSSFKSCAG